MQAGSLTMRHGLEKLHKQKESVQRQRVLYTSKHGTILEDEDVRVANSVASTRANSTDDDCSSTRANSPSPERRLADRLGDCRSLVDRRPAPQPASPPRSAGTASVIPTSTFDQQAPHRDQMDEIRGSQSDAPAWVHKWKGLKPREEIPSVDTIRAHKFQKDEATSNERFEQDVVENAGDPKFLRNQLVQKWVVPYWKSDSGVPMAWCCICSKEAWSPVHFYSTGHLKHCMSNPQTWEATWQYPKKCFTCVGDFHQGPESMPEVGLMALQDCPQSMLDWAASHLKLSKKPGNGKAASSNGRNLDVKTEDHFWEILDKAEKMLDDKVLDISTQLDLHCTQIDVQGQFIGLLEGQVITAKMREQDHSEAIVRAQKEQNRKLWHEISTLKDNMSVASQRILDLETNDEKSTQKILDLEMKNEKSTSGCFSGIMNWCR